MDAGSLCYISPQHPPAAVTKTMTQSSEIIMGNKTGAPHNTVGWFSRTRMYDSWVLRVDGLLITLLVCTLIEQSKMTGMLSSIVNI